MVSMVRSLLDAIRLYLTWGPVGLGQIKNSGYLRKMSSRLNVHLQEQNWKKKKNTNYPNYARILFISIAV